MAKHEFGIMDFAPDAFARYDEYLPQQYHCIIDDIYIEPIMPELDTILCYWHTRQVPGTGLAYCGVTLIPPESLPAMLSVMQKQPGESYRELILLFNKAIDENKYVIHYGL